jgi:hypothetical protein
VLAVTVECDEKIAYTRAETWAIRPDNHNLGDGGSDAGHFSKSVRSGATLVISLQSFKPALCFPR